MRPFLYYCILFLLLSEKILWKFSNKKSLVLSEKPISFSPFGKENSVTGHVALFFSRATRKLSNRCEESLALLLVYSKHPFFCGLDFL